MEGRAFESSTDSSGFLFQGAGGAQVFIPKSGAFGTFVADKGSPPLQCYFTPSGSLQFTDAAALASSVGTGAVVTGIFTVTSNPIGSPAGLHGYLSIPDGSATGSFKPDSPATAGSVGAAAAQPQDQLMISSSSQPQQQQQQQQQPLQVSGQFLGSNQDQTPQQQQAQSSPGQSPGSQTVSGTAYTSTSGTNIFVPNTGTQGTLHLQFSGQILQVEGFLFNGATPSTAQYMADDANQITAALRSVPSTRGVFVPNGGSGGGVGSIQLTVALDGTTNSIVITMVIPGQRGSLAMGPAAGVADPSKGEFAVTMLDNNGLSGISDPNVRQAIQQQQEQLTPQTPKPSSVSPGSIHGTYYKVQPKNLFIPDYPGTAGTFVATKGGATVTGTFFTGDDEEHFLPDSDVLASVLPYGQGLRLAGLFVPDEGDGGQPATLGSPGIVGNLEATPTARNYIFKVDVPGSRGWVSSTSPQGRSLTDNGIIFIY
jgi:hypothetical protein